jgi:hypothetical protein
MIRTLLIILLAAIASAQPAWQNDLAPINAADWNYDRAAHLLERAGFGGTPEEITAREHRPRSSSK